MPKQTKRKSSVSDSNESDENEKFPRKLHKSSSDNEPRPGTSAQALKEMREEQAAFIKSQKRQMPANETNSIRGKRVRPPSTRRNATSEDPPRKTTKEDIAKQSTDYLLNKEKGKFDYEHASGIIKKISLYNFMCHSSFHKEWHPNLNFVTGENGSGKSALLSGILIGLGARALATSRTKSISQLIQTGKDYAKTEITLLNSGGLCEKTYGKEFMIERIINMKGSSQYKIKCNGKFRPLLRAELDHLHLALDIQLDNPIMILNQETARSFLRSKDPKAKYKLFYEGTMMSKLSALLNESSRNVDICSLNLRSFKGVLQTVRHEIQSLSEEYSKIIKIEKIKETIEKIYAEYLWAVVKEVEDKKENEELSLQVATSEVEKYESKLGDTQKKKDETLARPSDKEKEAEARSSLKVKETAFNQLRSTNQETRSKIMESRAKLKSCNSVIEQRKERLEECKVSIEMIEKKARENEEKMRAEYSAKKDQLDSRKSSVTQQLNTLKEDAEQFRRGSDDIRKEMHDLEDQVATLNRRIVETQKNVGLLRKSTSNKFSIFGKDMEELLAKVNANERNFKKKPIGPVGAYCTIKDPKWVNLIEFALKGSLNTFLLDNHDDARVLEKLIEGVYSKYDKGNGSQMKQRPSKYISKFMPKAYDISDGEARIPGIPTLMDLIDIEDNNPIIFNFLCDSVSAEKLLLFESKNAALNVVGNESRCPSTCKGGFSLDFYNVTPQPFFAVWALQNPKYQATCLKTSTKEQISALRSSLASLQTELAEIKPILEEKKREDSRLREELNSRQNAMNEVRKKLHKVEMELQQLEHKRSYQPDLTSQREELEDLTREYNNQIAMKETAAKCLEENLSKMKKIIEEKNSLQAEIGELTKLISGFAEKADSRQAELRKIDNVIGRLTEIIKKYKKEQEGHQKNIDTIENELQRKLKKAEEKGPRIETDREPSDLENEFKTMKEAIHKSSETLNSKEEIMKKLKKTKIKEASMSLEYKAFSVLFKMVGSLVVTQEEFFERSLGIITNYLVSCFLAMANSRGYQGNLLIEHDSKELYYFVCPDSESHTQTQKTMQRSQTNKNMRKQLVEYSLGLSGGERSFATICFIIAMWKVMSCPFFMLDEFDVFMDPFNRKASQNALISHAKQCSAHQFFFFTPLELTQLPTEEEGSVLRMFPPVRNVEESGIPSPTSSVGEVENTDPSDGSQSNKKGSKKSRPVSTPFAMREKTNSRR